MKFSRYPVTDLGSRRIYFVLFFHICLLLIAFAVFLPRMLRPAGLAVVLPRSLTSEPVADDGLVIALNARGEIFMDGRLFSLAELKKVLMVRPPSENISVLIKADRHSYVGRLAEIWDLCRAAGFVRVSIATNA